MTYTDPGQIPSFFDICQATGYKSKSDNSGMEKLNHISVLLKVGAKREVYFCTSLMTMLGTLSRRFLSLFFLCGILCLVNGARPSRFGAQHGM
jgi:hypothetical protein